jgi:Rps23 Pro-64 3,4-dihydroxylase Tpa1-like proline 4-hydroxylase
VRALASGVDGYRGLRSLFAERADDFAAAKPFPHAVFANLFNPEVLRQSAAEFAPFSKMSSQAHSENEIKSAESRWESFGPATRAIVAEMQSATVIGALEVLTRIPGLISDPELWGGGQHQIRRGGRLGVHADFNRHPNYPMGRRLNALLYLNESWQPEWGGNLELWDEGMQHPVETIEPTINTLVVFETSSTSYHGHPEPLQCPEDRSRRSLAFYYYTIGEGDSASHSTLFRPRPGERFQEPTRASESIKHLKQAVYPWVPTGLRRGRQSGS